MFIPGWWGAYLCLRRPLKCAISDTETSREEGQIPVWRHEHGATSNTAAQTKEEGQQDRLKNGRPNMLDRASPSFLFVCPLVRLFDYSPGPSSCGKAQLQMIGCAGVAYGACWDTCSVECQRNGASRRKELWRANIIMDV